MPPQRSSSAIAADSVVDTAGPSRAASTGVPPLTLDTHVQFLKGVGPRMAKLLEKVGIRTAGDLLTYFPRDYQDRSRARFLSRPWTAR